MRKTVFYEDIKKMGAFFSNFAGWEMPIYISSIKEEHFAVRKDVGVFDVSHMVFLDLKGEKVFDFLNSLVPVDLDTKEDGDAIYSILCNENAGIIDDVLIYRKNKNEFYLVANAGHDEKVYNWLCKFNNMNVDIKLESKAILAIQGSKSDTVIKQIFNDLDSSSISSLQYYKFLELDDIIVARTGYTGEFGFEIIMPFESKNVFKLWDKIKELDVKICGLGARNILRLEAGYSLYGHELREDISPLEAGLGWAVDLDKEDFVGKKALLNQKQKGITKKLVGLILPDKRFIPRNGNEIFLEDKRIGYITSGSYSFFLDKTIALGYIDTKYLDSYNKVQVLIRNKKIDAEISKTRFYCNKEISKKCQCQ
jgi:aminomethyltransferase